MKHTLHPLLYKAIIMGFILKISHPAVAQQAIVNSPVNFTNQMYAPQANFYTIQQAAKNYYSTVTDVSEGGNYAQFQRWQWFWESRVDATSSAGFESATQALQTLLQYPICTMNSSTPANWQLLGPIVQKGSATTPPSRYTQNMGIITSVAVDPNDPNTIYAGSNSGGLWRTTNANTSNPVWNNLTDDLRLPGLGVNDIVVNPIHSNIIYIATGISAGLGGGYGVGVLKSIDKGLTWKQVSPVPPSSSQVTRKLLLDASQNHSDILYALVRDAVYKTINGGDSWKLIFQLPNSIGQNPNDPSGMARFLRDIEMKPTDPNTLYISSDDAAGAILFGNNNGSLMYKTTDGGANWNPVTIDAVNGTKSTILSIAVTPKEPNSVFVCYDYISSDKTVIQKSIDGGDTWTVVFNTSNLGVRDLYPVFAVSPTDAKVIYTGGLSFYKSTNGGNTFSSQNSGHDDVRALLIFDQSGNDVLIQGNDGGVSMTNDGGNNWFNKNGTGLAITQFYGLGGSELAPDLISGGTQDNDIFTNNLGEWSVNVNQDGGDVVIDKNNSNILYGQKWCCGPGTYQIYISNDAGKSWGADIKPSTIANTTRPMLMHSNNFLYVGYDNVYKALTPNISRSSWSKISNFSTNFGVSSNAALTALDVAPSDANIIYAAYSGPCWGCTNPHFLFKTIKGGGTNAGDWTDLTNNLPSIVPQWVPIKDIVIASDNPNKVWITGGSFSPDITKTGIYNGNYRVLKSEDGGTTWIDYSKGLTQFPVNSIVYEKGSNDGLYVGTDVGVFYTNKKLYDEKGWVCFNDNLPTCIVTDLEINYATNSIRAATFGRGIWESGLACPSDYDVTVTNDIPDDSFYEASNNVFITANSNNITNLGTFTARAGNEIIVSASGTGEAILKDNTLLFIHGCDHLQPNSFKKAEGNFEHTTEEPREETVVKNENIKMACYPNPFTEHLHIDFLVEKEGPVKVCVYNSMGQMIEVLANGIYSEGEHTLLFENTTVSKGVYFLSCDVNGNRIVKPLMKME